MPETGDGWTTNRPLLQYGILFSLKVGTGQKHGVKTLEWDPSIQRRINMGFGKVYSTQVGLVLNKMNGSISQQFNIILVIHCIIVFETHPQVHMYG